MLKYSSIIATPNKWADELQPELLRLIVKKLASNFMDIVHFETVCSSWNYAARWCTSAVALPPQYPWLMLPTLKSPSRWPKLSGDGDGEGICFFNPAENKVYKMDWKVSQGFPGDVDSPSGSSHDGQLVGGSSHGWLVMLEVGSILFDEIYGILLFNPISRKSKTLPPLRRCESSIRKVMLSSDLSCNNNFVVVIHDTMSRSRPRGLTSYQHDIGGENDVVGAQTDLEDSHDHYGGYFDIVLHNNGHYLFALSLDHSIQVWDFGDTYNNHPTKIMIFQPSIVLSCMTSGKKWLLELMGELLLVVREYLGHNCRGAEDFYVYKLNIAAKTQEKVESLRDCALFLARNQSALSFSLSTKELPRLKENSIHFTYLGHVLKLNESCGDKFYEIHVGGVYNLETKVVETYYPTRAPMSNKYWNSPPVWIVHSPCTNVSLSVSTVFVCAYKYFEHFVSAVVLKCILNY